MVRVAVVYQSGGGHTRALAEAAAAGAAGVEGVEAEVLEVRGAHVVDGRWRDEHVLAAVDRADAVVFACTTYMGSVSAVFKAFLEGAFMSRWIEQRWKDKFAGGMTNSASQNGDKLSTLIQLNIFAMQMGMIWVGVSDPPGNNWSGGATTDINRLGSWLGARGQSNGDQGPDQAPSPGDRLTAERYGRRIAQITGRWLGKSGYVTERISEEQLRAMNLAAAQRAGGQ